MTDIDMENFGRQNGPAAGGNVDTNSYHQEEDGAYVHQELLEPASNEAVTPPPDEPLVNPQAEHFRLLREEVDRIKSEKEAEKRDYQLQLDMLRANLRESTPPPQAQPERKMFDGLEDGDVPSVAEIRREWEQRESSYQARLEELQVQQTHPDYKEVVEKFAIPLVKEKPHLLQGLQYSSNKALYAYELGKMAQQIESGRSPPQTPSAPQRSESAQKMVDNSRKPGTLSQAGGQGALSQADYFASMSDQEFMKMATRNLEGI